MECEVDARTSAMANKKKPPNDSISPFDSLERWCMNEGPVLCYRLNVGSASYIAQGFFDRARLIDIFHGLLLDGASSCAHTQENDKETS